MSHKEALEHLAVCVKKGWNFRWHGHAGIRGLGAGADHALVERAMKIILPWSPAECLDKLPDEYVPIAWRVLAAAENPEATFLVSYDTTASGKGLRAGSAWLKRARMISGKRNRERLPALCRDKAGLAAARATVVKHGVETPALLAVLAHDGSADSIDALVEVIDHASSTKDEALDVLFEWFVPSARGAKMIALAEELTSSRDVRGDASSVQELAARFGVKKKARFTLVFSVSSRQVHVGLTRKVTAHIELSSHALPNVELMISRNLGNSKLTWWKDGIEQADDNKLGKPSSLDDIPRWLVASARTLRVTWDRDTLRVHSSLRGNARQTAIDWLLSSSQ